MPYRFDFGAVLDRAPELLWGSLGTLGLALAGMLLALVIGILGVVARTSKSEITRTPVIVFVEVVRNTPFLVQIFFIYFALPLMGIRFNPTVTAIIALGINGGAYAIEIIRGGVESVSRGQIEAGFALGLHKADVFRLIVLKPALRAIYPSLTSQFIMLTLTTSVCTSIAAYELTSAAQRIESDTFRSFEVYFTVTAIYLVISTLMMGLFALISRRYFNYPTR
ncbi:amino acid ABC transporter permease [Sinorhizobium alkalisoli]|uniref:ABC transporter permease n=1 Tax=Sinorhizobium alkalisoli TaxID=1752398 RepID=A0A1E3VD06_9HYPH|nr:amino acid ABC transporter permease [Sinorhizobium alkalisoli]MCA1492370.1 amino acid ABC transporter permease [Ensifer sp. NBAIM29]MCG5480565.1 amino acid ABC transporter permease [Sinorhizobium alkalisoli]ODR91415.1 ABC transporter permease [Sinorhizobium alkalisoli]QFI66479.1 polar amino acid ABC transporter, inner membrane subunit [Sinorhizobium alkalisoli]